MARYFLTLSYNGGSFNGWQIQDNTPNTVQQILEEKVAMILKEKIEFYSRGKSKSDVALFLEKEEMRKNLIEIIFDCVGHSEMTELNSYIYELKGLSVEPFDRQNLIKAILKTK